MLETISFALVGAGGFGREVMPWAKRSLAVLYPPDRYRLDCYFVVSSPTAKVVNGVPCIGEPEFAALPGTRLFNVAIGNSRTREAMAERLAAHASPVSLVADTATILDRNEIGDGLTLCPFAMITSNARVGRHFHANIFSYVAHDCVIGDYVTFAPAVKCNGNVHIGDHAYIGTGAILRHGTPEAPLIIGERAVVGMGAVVTRNVPPDTTVVGNPARPMDPKR
jgi:sugar O-acyltransferase (sialic acid O-acetyltransferase NeuD family)